MPPKITSAMSSSFPPSLMRTAKSSFGAVVDVCRPYVSSPPFSEYSVNFMSALFLAMSEEEAETIAPPSSTFHRAEEEEEVDLPLQFPLIMSIWSRLADLVKGA